MNSQLETILIVGSLLSAAAGFIWVAARLGSKSYQKDVDYTAQSEKSIEIIFNDDFREELRNRGRMHFEKIINDNAMFLQQDLRLTSSQINEHMKQEINKSLKDAFAKYQESIEDAKNEALASMGKTKELVESERSQLMQQLDEAVDNQKKQIITRFENNMSEIVNHYIVNAIGNQIDLEDQLEYILAELENNKKAIIEDINQGA